MAAGAADEAADAAALSHVACEAIKAKVAEVGRTRSEQAARVGAERNKESIGECLLF